MTGASLLKGEVKTKDSANTLKPATSPYRPGSAPILSSVASVFLQTSLPGSKASNKRGKLPEILTNFNVNVVLPVTVTGSNLRRTTVKGVSLSSPETLTAISVSVCSGVTSKPVDLRSSASNKNVPGSMPCTLNSIAEKLSSIVKRIPRKSASTPPVPSSEHCKTSVIQV